MCWADFQPLKVREGTSSKPSLLHQWPGTGPASGLVSEIDRFRPSSDLILASQPTLRVNSVDSLADDRRDESTRSTIIAVFTEIDTLPGSQE